MSNNASTIEKLAEVSKVEASLRYSFPESYRKYLVSENPIEHFVGTNYVRFYTAENLLSENCDDWREFFPNTLRIGDTGALENFVINYDFSPPRFGMLPHIGDKTDFIYLGMDWSQLIERLENDTIWDNLVRLRINGSVKAVPPGITVATAIMNTGVNCFRDSVSGSARGPLCGMGICFECRVTINGIPNQRSCTMLAENGMELTTSETPE